jgi:hypothetical protein
MLNNRQPWGFPIGRLAWFGELREGLNPLLIFVPCEIRNMHMRLPQIKRPVSRSRLVKLVDKRKRVDFVIGVPFDDLLKIGIDGLNDRVDEIFGWSLNDITFKPVGVGASRKVLLHVSGDASDSIDWSSEKQ